MPCRTHRNVIPVRRYASLDFLRGMAIFMMIILHTISWTLDVDGLLGQINDVPVINIVALVVLPYLGGLAGFFLLVSAISNTISMYRHLQAGKPVNALILRQVMGGILLLVFAMLAEGLTGYLGAFGNYLRQLPDGTFNWTTVLERWQHFETIHTIAWCVVLNGIVQGIISRNGAWKDLRKTIITYLVLAIIVVAATQPVWMLVESIQSLPPWEHGYPWNLDTGAEVFRPVVGAVPFWMTVANIFLTALAAPMEPVLPYLAVSFVGTIIGAVLAQPRESIPKDFPKKVMVPALVAFLVGTAGVIIFVIIILDGRGFEAAADVYRQVSFHRHWFNKPGWPETFSFPGAWLFQFLSLNGFGVMLTILIIRLVEFRGWSAGFARKTTFVRRFGFTAFTNYNNQWYMWLIWFAVGGIFFNQPYKHMDWGGVGLVIAATIAAYHGIMLLWEKVRYTGTIEWCIATIAAYLIPARKDEADRGKRWWEKGQLDVDGAFYNAEWLDIVKKEEIDHEHHADSKLAYKLALSGLVSILFIPVTMFTFPLAREALKTEGANKHAKVAYVVSIIGLVLTIAFFAACSVLSLSMLGLSL